MVRVGWNKAAGFMQFSAPPNNSVVWRSMRQTDDTKLQTVSKGGILTLHIPKSEEAKPKAIEVKVA